MTCDNLMLRPDTEKTAKRGRPVTCQGLTPMTHVDLDALIRVKRAAGRPKDLEVLAELEALREERDRQDD